MIRSIRDLTPRQREIALLISEGDSYAEIGAQLGISEHTVRAHARTMANLIDDDGAFPPRTRILVLMKEQELAAKLAAAVAEARNAIAAD
jgi:DNA-binding NarL/FixJ family response regulator